MTASAANPPKLAVGFHTGGGPVLERSLKWFGDLLDELGYESDLTQTKDA
jgi:hypothetical protein